MSSVILVILAQVIFLILGIYFLEFEIKPLEVIIVLIAAIITETAFAYFLQRRLYFPTSAVAAALGLGIFLRTDQIWIYILAAFLTIASKFVIRVGGKHIFNPSNFGILAVVYLFTSHATIDLTHWGNNLYIYLLISLVALLVAFQAKVIITTLSFLSSYLILLLLTLPFIPNIVSVHHYGLIGPSLVIFASFMITDPRTSPTGTKLRIAHGITVAILYFILEIIGIRYSLFLASFLTSLTNTVIRSLQSLLQKRLSLATLTPNITTFVLVVVIFTILIIPYFSHPSKPFTAISSKFLLMGVESEELLACQRDSIFTDATSQAGLKLLADTWGAAFGDVNNDGWDDLFVSNLNKPSILYLNNKDGTFKDITTQAGLTNHGSSSAFFVDYDNNGALDLFMAHVQKDAFNIRVFKNQGNSKFKEVTADLGLLLPWEHVPTNAATFTFADYDNDGYLDFILALRGLSKFFYNPRVALGKSVDDPFFNQGSSLVCNRDKIAGILAKDLGGLKVFIEQNIPNLSMLRGCLISSNKLEVTVREKGLQEDLTVGLDVQIHIPGGVYLFRNLGGEKFEEVASFSRQNREILERTYSEQIVYPKNYLHPYNFISGRYYQPISFDYNNDGLIDIFLAIDYGTNLLFKNLGNFQFEDVTVSTGLNWSGSGMGVDVADLDKNGYFDLVVTNTKGDYLFYNQGERFAIGQFVSVREIGWGTVFFDYNLDGYEDLFVANGDTARTISLQEGRLNRPIFRTDRLYKGTYNGLLKDTTDIDICADRESGRALATTDYDNDGDPDLFVGNIDFSPKLQSSGNTLYRNSATNRHYLRINLKGSQSNSFGVGAIVKVSTDNLTQSKLVIAGGSFFSQNSYTLIFGLGQNTKPIAVDVIWPSGKISHLDNVRPNQTLVIKE